MNNEYDKAELYFERISREKVSHSAVSEICLTATKGLFHFQQGESTLGRKLYEDAIKKASELKNQHLMKMELLNLSREEIKIKSEFGHALIEYINQYVGPKDLDDIQILKTDILREWSK